MKNIIIYTDGACSGNPGPGGWGAVLIYNGKIKEISGGELNTTNNRMELMATIRALETLKESCQVMLYSDSAYIVNAFNEDWISKWVLSGWKKADKKEVLNADLWKRLLELLQVHKVTWNKVKGHSDNDYNNRCDYLARSEVEKLMSEGK